MVISLLVATWTERKLLESVHVRCRVEGYHCRNCVAMNANYSYCTYHVHVTSLGVKVKH